MAVVEIHTGIISSPKHAPLSDGALRLWLNALCWSKEHLTDGFIPEGTLRLLHLEPSQFLPELLRVLVPGKGPLWHRAKGGYTIHDYEQWQETKGRVQERRQQWRERKNRQRVTRDVTQDVPLSVPRDVHARVPRASRVIHAHSPSDGSGGGRGIKQIPPTPKGEDALFAAFWDAYPRHIGKAAAFKAWKKIKPDPTLAEAMISAIAWQRRQLAWTKEDGAFIPYPATWLNARRWEDEHPDGPVDGRMLDDDGEGTPLPPWRPGEGARR